MFFHKISAWAKILLGVLVVLVVLSLSGGLLFHFQDKFKSGKSLYNNVIASLVKFIQIISICLNARKLGENEF